MRLILTRPRRDSEELAAKLRECGHESRILPLLDIVPRGGITIPALAYQAICVTSANAFIAAPAFLHLRDLPLVCVGPQSLAAARALGFTAASAHGGDVEGLVSHIATKRSPQSGPILYLSGSETSGDLEGKLSALGFSVTRIVVYEAVPQHPDDLAAAAAWAQGVMLYSPRTAKLWTREVERQGADASRLLHICLSQNVAKALPPDWPRRIAQTPDESAILASLESPTEGA